MKYCDVILPLSLTQLFTYHVPSEYINQLKPGLRVIVEFGRKKMYTAIVFRVHTQKPAVYKTKPVISLIDDSPIVTNQQLKLWEWVASYYMCSVGEVMKAGLPSGLKLESETKIFLNRDFIADSNLPSGEEEILNFLYVQGATTIREVNAKLTIKNTHVLLKSLINKKAVTAEEIIKDSYQPKKEKYISLNKKYYNEQELNQLFNQLKKAKTQQKLVLAFMAFSTSQNKLKNKEIKKSQLLEHARSGLQPLKALIDKEIFIETTREISRLSIKNEKSPLKEFTSNQLKAYQKILKLFEEKNTVLLHGVTSSGKTEIYIHLIKQFFELGKQVLYLLPEIALTAQIINRLRNVFGKKAGIYHSKFNDNERVEVYNGVMKGVHEENAIRLILGVRSSVLLPFHDLGLIIVDEEHENTYKQFDPAPRYNARDTAIYLSTIHNAKVILGSATPSIESYFNAKTGKYGLVELTERYGNIELPEIIIANTREAYRKKEMKSFFSPVMLNSLTNSLNNKEQAILFKNRRGYAPYIECETCNWIPYCKNCDVTLTYHRKRNELNCHYCGYSIKVPVTCDVCNQPALQTKGFGTEKIEDELAVFFPDARIQRMDLDSTRSKKAYEKIISDFENKQIDILVGTQMISKGLDFDNVSLVGVMNADSMLNFPDFRAHERSFQLMAQVSGRAGRKNKRGKVIIQVSDAGHPVIDEVVQNNFKSLFIRQLEERKMFRYPPYYRLIMIKVKHKDRETVNHAAFYLAQQLFNHFGNRINGPEFPLIERIQNLFQKNILIKIESEKVGTKVKNLIKDSINKLLGKDEYRNVRIIIDVDPM